jgi:hypothetical protein
MGRTCGTNEERRGAYGILVGKPEGRNRLKGPNIDGRIILERIFERSEWGGIDWIDLSQDRDRWRALVNAVMNLRVP